MAGLIRVSLSAASYVLSCIGVLMGLCWILRQQPQILDFLHGQSPQPLSPEIRKLDTSLVSALALTTLLPSFPVLRDIDSNMLRLFHKMGEIPVNAMLWAQRMNSAPLRVTDQMLENDRQFIFASSSLPNILANELASDPKKDLAYRFTKNLSLLVAMKSSGNYERFATEFIEDATEFDRKAGVFFAHSISFFTLIRQLSMSNLQPPDDVMENFKGIANSAFDEIRHMFARVLLFTCRGETEIARTLQGIGFQMEVPSPIHIPRNQLALDLVGVTLIFVVSAILQSGGPSVSLAISIGLFVALNHVIAAAFALLPKQFWGFADIRRSNERPYLGYLVSSVCTLTVTFPLAYAFHLFRHILSPVGGHILPFTAQCKWLVLPTILAFALSFLCDDYAEFDEEPVWLSWVEAIGLGVVMACAGLLAISWLQADQLAAHPNGHSTSLWPVAMMSALIGMLFGATIPTWYRTTLRRSTIRPIRRLATPSPA